MREAFEQAIEDSPDDPASYAAYGDWLAERGDPRGELIQVQLALEGPPRKGRRRQQLKRREKRLLEAHQREWLGPLAPVLLDPPPEPADPILSDVPEDNYEYRFARGFLHALRIKHLTVPMARALRDAPQ